MSRTESIQLRLDDLKVEFTSLLTVELENVAAGRWSRYLSRKEPHVIDGRFWATPESDHLEKLEEDIRALARKLHDVEAATLLGLVEEYIHSVALARDRAEGGMAHIARQILRKLPHKEPAT